jgi:3-oxoadipate enol-lactonase
MRALRYGRTVIEQLTVDVGIPLRVRAWGDPAAPAMLLLHGLTGDGSSWDDIAPRFADRYRVLAPDLRGHGLSGRAAAYSFELMRDDVAAMIGVLGLRRPVVIGHSLGAVVGYLLAQRHPELLSVLVLEEGPPARPLDRPPLPTPDEPTPYDFAVVNAIRAQLREPQPSWWDDLARISAPTLVIAGGPSSAIPQDLIAQAADRIPGSRLVTIDAGHLVHTGEPDEFCRVVEEFLADAG